MRCVTDLTGDVRGVFRADTDAIALDEMARDYGFDNFEALSVEHGARAELYVVDDAELMLKKLGRELVSGGYKGYAWRELATSDASTVPPGLDKPYDNPLDNCSVFYPTMAEAALRGLKA